jgi:tetratricopeptide (TPR) repeat protein
MMKLDNQSVLEVNCSKNLTKLGLVAFALSLVFGGIACQKASTSTADRPAVRPSSEAIAEAERFYAGRADLVKVRQAIVSLRQAQADDPVNYDLAWRLAKFNYYLGSHSPDSTEQGKAFREGIEAGKLAVKLQDGKPDGHFWLGANYGGSAKLSTLSGLSEVEDIKNEMGTVIKLDESYQAGSAYIGLGQVYLEAPTLLGGDLEKAIQYLEKGVKVGPDNATLKAKLAEAYVTAHRYDDARKQLEALKAMKPDPDYQPEYNDAIADAQKVEEKIK